MVNAKQIRNFGPGRRPLGHSILGIGLFLLILVSSPVLAKPDCDKNPVHPSCNPDEGGSSPIAYSAAIIACEGDDPPFDHTSRLYEPGLICEGRAHTQTNITVLLPNGTCADLTTSNDVLITQTRALNVLRNNKNGAIVSAWFFGQAVTDEGVRAYRSKEMVDAPFFVEDLGEGVFIVHLHADVIDLFQCDAPRIKGKTVCDIKAGTFAIDDVIYFPTP